MSETVIATIILVGLFFFLLSIRTPIVFAIGIPTLVCCYYLNINPMVVCQKMVEGINKFTLMAVPFFILMGEVMSAGGISDRIVKLADALVGWLPGGLSCVNCVDSMFFGGISGSSAADCASLGPILIPMMVKQGYDKDFATAITMASSVEGILIPPSHNMVTYSLVAGSVSVGRLFLAGYIPGFGLGLAFLIYCIVVSIKRGYPRNDTFSLKVVWQTAKEAIWGLLSVLIVVVGVVAGIFTATESAAIACVWAFIVTFIIHRERNLKDLWKILGNALKTLAMVMILIGTSAAFGWMLSYLKIPDMVCRGILAISTNRIIVPLIINFLLLILGMLMDMSAIILISTPVLLTVAAAVGVDPVHFGIIMVLNLGIGLITPPVGSTLFIGSAISGISIEKLAKSLIPFYLLMVLVLIIVTYFPQTIMWLPNMMMPLATV